MHEPDLNLGTYRAALALWAAVLAITGYPRESGLTWMRSAGWTALALGSGLVVTHFIEDDALGRWALRESGLAAVLALTGIVMLIETGSFSPRAALAAMPAVGAVAWLQVLAAALRIGGWLAVVPCAARALPWWFGLPTGHQSFTGFAQGAAVAAALVCAGGLLRLALRRRVTFVEAVNRVLGQALIFAATIAGLSLTFVLIGPDLPWPAQALRAVGVTAVAAALCWTAVRAVRRRMGLPQGEQPSAAWVRRRLSVWWRRMRWRPRFAIIDLGRRILVEGDLAGAPASAVSVRARRKRLYIDVAEPTDRDATYTSWTCIVVLPRPIEPIRTEAWAVGGRMFIRAFAVPRRRRKRRVASAA